MISFVSKHAEMTEGLNQIVNFCRSARLNYSPVLFRCLAFMHSEDQETDRLAAISVWQTELKNSDPACTFWKLASV